MMKKKWLMRVLQALLVFGGYIWIDTAVFLVNMRMEIQRPWIRLAVILGVAALFTAASALVFETKALRRRAHFQGRGVFHAVFLGVARL